MTSASMPASFGERASNTCNSATRERTANVLVFGDSWDAGRMSPTLTTGPSFTVISEPLEGDRHR